MTKLQKTLRTCENGHQYYKSTDCPTCPQCEEEKKPSEGFLSKLSAPARRALENADIKNLSKLSTYTEKEILNLHGMGKASISTLRKALVDSGLTFKPMI